MNETIRRIFKDAFDEAENRGINKGINEDKERVATDMLKDNYTLSAIEKIQ